MTEAFYVVWQPEHGIPKVQHDSLEQAKAEAERLARLSPGKKFFVLRAMSVSRHVSVDTVDLFDPLPF